MNQKDYYQILGVDRNASQQQIREAYRKLAFQYHPDRNQGNPAATERMKEINEAYSVLSDSRKRNEYDSLRQQYGPFAYDRFRQSYSQEDIFRGSDINQIFEEMARMFSGLRGSDEIFREFYGPGYRSFEFRRPGVFGRGFIFSGPLGGYGRRYREGRERIPAEEMPIFPGIPFTGILGKLAKYALKKISGIEMPERGRDWRDVINLFPDQAQRGGKIIYPYKKWGKPKDLEVKIPSGIKDGQSIRLKGMGAPGKGGAEPGDLYLEVRIRVPLSRKIKKYLGWVK
ncbi:molecular chaperone DnaJ [candidate division WWE3 bacterium CG10_big_fil_rev_8_21_14_0_10_39_14]|nr:MAG: molecular chaperone DnaJ [candidate division WWE3 bacterium CG10_big_fil_rev_8_21_14_0_10_39_14]